MHPYDFRLPSPYNGLICPLLTFRPLLLFQDPVHSVFWCSFPETSAHWGVSFLQRLQSLKTRAFVTCLLCVMSHFIVLADKAGIHSSALIILCLILCLFSNVCAGNLFLSRSACVHARTHARPSQQTFPLPEASQFSSGELPTPPCAWFGRGGNYR